MKRSLFFAPVLVLAAAAAAPSGHAVASTFYANQVASYTPGTAPTDSSGFSSYTQSGNAALGPLAPVTDTYNDILTPFNGPYLPTQLVAVGDGGTLELHLAEAAGVSGVTIGVHTIASLNDQYYASTNPAPAAGTNFNPAQTLQENSYGVNPSADVQVSENGATWVDLGTITFNNPSNYYADVSGPYATTAGTTPANFGQPFTGTLASFNGLDFQQTLAQLNGSAGGTWLNLTPAANAGLTGVNYIKFNVPTGAVIPLYVDAVVGTNASIPEPATVAFLAVGALALSLRRRRSGRTA